MIIKELLKILKKEFRIQKSGITIIKSLDILF